MLLITINSLFLEIIAVTLACPGSELSVSPPRWKTLGEGNEDSRIHQKVSGVRQAHDATFRGIHKGGWVVTAESAIKGCFFLPFLTPCPSSFHTMWCDTQFRAWRNIVQGYDWGPFYVWILHNSWSKSRFSCSIFGVKTLLCFLFFAFSIPSLTATVKWEGLTATNTSTLFPRIPFQLFFFFFSWKLPQNKPRFRFVTFLLEEMWLPVVFWIWLTSKGKGELCHICSPH